MPDANFAAALVVIAVASVSFIGIGMMTAVLPLISPEKGTQLGFIAQGMLLVVSGVYYPVDVLPTWMQWIAVISPATYALDGIRDAILGRGRRDRALGRDLAADRDRRRLDPARALGLRPRRAVREAAREAEAVGMIRVAATTRELEAYVAIWNAITPDEPADVAQQRERRSRDPRAAVPARRARRRDRRRAASRAAPTRRGAASSRRACCPRRGGAASAARCSSGSSQHLTAHGFESASAHVDGRDEGSLAFARRHGFEEVDRQVEQVRALGGRAGRASRRRASAS